MFVALAWFAVALAQAETSIAPPANPVASSVCVAPTAPPAVRPSLPPAPKLPSCVNEAKGTHTCRHGEIERYNVAMKVRNNAFEDFLSAANAYSMKLNQYDIAASEYARCEMREVRKAQD